ncbi:MAG: hypothetical protein CMJ83_09400 [Planctomycetes bacterium]|nr:hypothetical protein [Planctomycetota bacterium]
MDRIILGDNQFFGVNHRSEEQAIASMRRFQDDRAILDVIDTAYDVGIRGFTFSTHSRMAGLCDHFRNNPDRYSGMRFYPAVPYAHKYAELVNERGLAGALKEAVLTGMSMSSVAGLVKRGSSLLFTKDALKAMEILVDIELKTFRDLDVRVVYLQNIVTDLLVGLGWTQAAASFHRFVKDRFGVEAGFITLNLPRTLDFLDRAGIENPIVCSAINSMGFQMSPDRASYEEVLNGSRPFRGTAMSVMAAGAISPSEAISYVTGFPRIESVMFGASSRRNIAETKALIDGAS